MSQAQFTIPLIVVIPGQLIASALWNNEFQNISTNLNPSGVGGYSDTDTQMQIQTAPYPGSVTSHATSLGGEIERIRFQISAIMGSTTPDFWYAKPPIDLTTLSNGTTPIGGVIDYPSATPPSASYLLANGQAIGRVAYATLFALIGTTFGAGDASTTFNIPNYTDLMSITAGNLYALGATGGAVSQAIGTANLPASPLTVNISDPGHTHSISDPSHSHGVTDPQHLHKIGNNSGGGAGVPLVSINATGGGSLGSAQNTSSASTGISVNSASTGITGANSNTTGITASTPNMGSGTALADIASLSWHVQTDQGAMKIFDDGILEATLLPNRWVFVRWVQNKHGRLQKKLIKDLNAIEQMILGLKLPGWITSSELAHTDFHKLLEKFGARAREIEGEFQFFVKPILKAGDLHKRTVV